MNEKLELALQALVSQAFNEGWHSHALEYPGENDATLGYTDQYRATEIEKSKGYINDNKAAIRELFQAQIYADANVGELITALRDEAYLHGYAIAMQDVGRVANVKTRGQRADAAEGALRKALGVQR